jgi:hypothetical protein
VSGVKGRKVETFGTVTKAPAAKSGRPGSATPRHTKPKAVAKKAKVKVTSEAKANARIERQMRTSASNPTGEFRGFKRGSGTPSKVKSSAAVSRRAPSAVKNTRSPVRPMRTMKLRPQGGGIDLGRFADEVGRNLNGLIPGRDSRGVSNAMKNAPKARAALKKSTGK